MHEMRLDEKWFKLISEGKKTVEGRINDDKRKLFFQGYSPVSNTITVKDISYKVLYTKRKKLEYSLSEIDRIQLRLDNAFNRALLLWYPNIFVHVVPQAVIGGIITGIAVVITGHPNIANPMMIYIVGNGFINSWPTAKKVGKGEWLSISLKGSNAWKIADE